MEGSSPAATTTVSAIRRRKRDARISLLRQQACELLMDHPNADLWLFGSWARGDWDAFSDVDLLAIAPSRGEANRLRRLSSRLEWPTTCWLSAIRNGRNAGRGMTPTGAPSAEMPCA